MSTIIFDFDGTIADSFEYVAGFLAHEKGLQKLEEAQLQELRHKSMIAMAKHIGFRWWQLPRLFYRGRNRMEHAIEHVTPFKGMPEVIRKLHNEGHELFIVSSNNVRNVRNFLHQHQLHTYFLQIYGGVSIFGKAPALRKLLKEHQLEATSALYIGDELRDVESAQSVNIKVVAVLWGFARTDDILALKPTATANTPAELLRVLEEL